MSMNIHIEGVRNAFAFKRNGEKVMLKDRRFFTCWQTPTIITRKILSFADNQARTQAYIDWVLANSSETQEAVYDYTSFTEDFEPVFVGTKTVNIGKEHVKELLGFLYTCHEEGFDVKFYET